MLLERYRRAVLPIVVFGFCAGVALADPKPDISGIEPLPITVEADTDPKSSSGLAKLTNLSENSPFAAAWC